MMFGKKKTERKHFYPPLQESHQPKTALKTIGNGGTGLKTEGFSG